MTTATLGGLIKDYRIKKRLSQFDVSLRIGWKDTSRLSKIEQGRVGKPTRETIEKVIEALELTKQEKGQLLFAGGYLPTNEEIAYMTGQVKERIDNWPHPSYLVDFSMRFLYMNKMSSEVFGLPQSIINSIPRLKPNVLEFVLAPKETMPVVIYKGDDRESVQPFIIGTIAVFKIKNIGRENDAWYKKLVSKLVKDKIFLKYWNSVKIENFKKKIAGYEYKIIEWPERKKRYQFHLFASQLIEDQRFEIVHYLPAT